MKRKASAASSRINGNVPRASASEYRDSKTIGKVEAILNGHRGRRPEVIFKAIIEVLPGILYEKFRGVFHEGITADELLTGLSASPPITDKSRPASPLANKKYGVRRDPLAVRRPKRKPKQDWRDNHDHLFVAGSDGMEGCRRSEVAMRRAWEQEGNFFHVMRAFAFRVDQFNRDNEERRKSEVEEAGSIVEEGAPVAEELPVPLWIASAIAEGFGQYISRRLERDDCKVTLDGVFGVAGNRQWRRFVSSHIDTEAVLDKTREVQWCCGLKFVTALRFAIRILETEAACEEGVFTFSHAKEESIVAQERRGHFPSLGAWLEDREETQQVAPEVLRSDFLEYVGILDEGGVLRAELEYAMRNPKLHM